MNKKKGMNTMLTFPSQEEIKIAQLACCGRCCNQCESPAAYAWRKRDVDLALLLEKAIHKELTKNEREAVIAHWFDCETVTQIANKKNINPSAVKRTLSRAEEKLKRVLSYVVSYQHNIHDESLIPLAIGKARVIAAARNATGGNSGNRITRLRQSQNISAKTMSDILGVNENRLAQLENGEQPNKAELSALVSFFEVSEDFILKGEFNDKKQIAC